MTVVINGTSGVTSVNGTAGAPSITGTDTDTGIVYGTNTITLATGGTSAVTVDSSQNVIVGATSASGSSKAQVVQAGINATSLTTTTIKNLGLKLSFDGVTNTDGYIFGGIAMGGGGEEYAGIAAYDNGGSAATGLKFFTGTSGGISAAATIDGNGNFFVNSASFPVVGTEKFGVQGSSTIAAAFANSSASNPTGFFANNTNGSVTLVRFASGSSGTTVGNITSNGTNTTYSTSSDYRLKENIAPMTGALSLVQQLNPVTYTWKSNGSDGQGFIAHELQAVVPECVVGEKDAVEIVGVKDEEGNVIGTEEKPVYQGIDTSFLVATLTAAIQELNAKVDAQAAEIATLKGQA